MSASKITGEARPDGEQFVHVSCGNRGFELQLPLSNMPDWRTFLLGSGAAWQSRLMFLRAILEDTLESGCRFHRVERKRMLGAAE